MPPPSADSTPPPAADLIVVGSGLGGLCAGALAASYGLEVLVLEAHSAPGGAAHGFCQGPFHFESGPSLWSGLSRWPSPNPLAQVLRLIGETLPVATYNDWGLLLPEGHLRVGVGMEPFLAVLSDLRGDGAVREWRAFIAELEPLCQAAQALPLLALRPGLGTAAVLGARGVGLVGQAGRLAQLGGAFAPLTRRTLSDPFLLHWVEMLCFLISGMGSAHTSAAAMATLFGEWFTPAAELDYPLGGSPAVVQALVRGLERHGGRLRTSAPVEKILVRERRARGVRLANGERLGARRGVICNASPWDTLSLLGEEAVPRRWRERQRATPACASFLHCHLALRGDDLAHLPIHHVWVGDWRRGIGAERNMAVLSMPSLLDASLAPPGHHVLHGYTPANEPWELWQHLERGSAAYAELKAERCAVFAQLLNPLIPDWRERLVIERYGTPLTHRSYLQVHQGSYGPAWPADRGPFPGGQTPVEGLVLCGSGVFPGIGVPPVAVSGAMAAHGFVSARVQRERLASVGLLA
ncbi:MAG: NAD(P)/FAD-dependent oxidoreductase [Cyanobacteriota bacterium]|nr:NAD(P)/FAD-dependent oxidoreductase [Cyanobacteriota bacterium]